MRVLHIIRRVTDGGASLGLLRMCVDGPPGVEHRVWSLLDAEPDPRSVFEASGVAVISGAINYQEEIAAADIVQLEWWNNPWVNDLIVNQTLGSARILLHSRGHFDAPWMCPSAALLAQVDGCTVTTPSAAQNSVFDANRRAAGLASVRCVFSSAAEFRGPRGERTQHKSSPETPVRFGYLGTVEPIKMHAQALRIAARVIRADPNVVFVFAGDGTLDEYRREAMQLGINHRVQFVGFQPDPYAFLSGLDVFFYPLNPLTYATSEKALQEAMLVGLPCVAFPFGGVRDLLTPESAMVVHSEDACVAACLELAGSEKRRAALGASARERIETLPQRVSWRDDLTRAWNELLARGPRQRSPIGVAPADLFAFCTDRAACDPEDMDASTLADFRRVAALVEEDYVAWLTFRGAGASLSVPQRGSVR